MRDGTHPRVGSVFDFDTAHGHKPRFSLRRLIRSQPLIRARIR